MKQTKISKMFSIKSVAFRNILLILSALLVIFTVSFTLFGFVITKDITIVEGGVATEVTTTRIYVDEMLAEQGIALRAGDMISKPIHSMLRNGDELVIKRGKTIYVTVDGGVKELYSCAMTLKDALIDAGISLGPIDEISPEQDTLVTDGMGVFVYRMAVMETTEEVVVPKQVITRDNPDELVGTTKVVTEGSDGSETVYYRVITRDGVEVSRTETSRVVTQEAVDQVVENGTKVPQPEPISQPETKPAPAPTPASVKQPEPAPVSEPAPKSAGDTKAGYKVKDSFVCSATAYTATPNGKGGFIEKTASGRPAGYGVVAVDPRVIPLGTRLYIESLDGTWTYGIAVAGDTGGAIKGKKVDLFFNTNKECVQFGRRQVKVYILE